MIEGLVAGKLYGRAEQRTGRSGKPFVVAKVRAAVAGDGEAVFVNVVAFEPGAQAALLALEDGDAVALAGTLAPKAWTDKTGAARPSLDMVAAQVMTAYRAKKKREAVAAADEQQQRPRAQAADDLGPEDDAWLAGGAP